ncbi:hypothetical protein JCM11641_006257 [Rhodosporidiobolus odoratus]
MNISGSTSGLGQLGPSSVWSRSRFSGIPGSARPSATLGPTVSLQEFGEKAALTAAYRITLEPYSSDCEMEVPGFDGTGKYSLLFQHSDARDAAVVDKSGAGDFGTISLMCSTRNRVQRKSQMRVAARVTNESQTRIFSITETPQAQLSGPVIHTFAITDAPSKRTVFLVQYTLVGTRHELGFDDTPSPSAAETLAKRAAGTSFQKYPNDLRLFFPHVAKEGAELWTSTDLLTGLSPYFADLLSSDLTEATTRHGKRPRLSTPSTTTTTADAAAPCASSCTSLPATPSSSKSASKRERPQRDFEDSDDELDDFLTANPPASLALDTSESDFSYREIRITESCYSTYRALLVWATTGHIEFAPLSSSASSSASDKKQQTHLDRLSSEPNLPLPVSAKSLYRLAHLLDLPSLQKLALTAYESQLGTTNCATELFGDASIAYEALREVALRYAVKNWKHVKDSVAMKRVERTVMGGGMVSAGPVLMQLLKATSSSM